MFSFFTLINYLKVDSPTEHLQHQPLRSARRNALVYVVHSCLWTTTCFSITFHSPGSSAWTAKALDIWLKSCGREGNDIAGAE